MKFNHATLGKFFHTLIPRRQNHSAAGLDGTNGVVSTIWQIRVGAANKMTQFRSLFSFLFLFTLASGCGDDSSSVLNALNKANPNSNTPGLSTLGTSEYKIMEKNLKGWNLDYLEFDYDFQSCEGVPKEKMSRAFARALRLWTSVPISRLQVVPGSRVSISAAKVITGAFPQNAAATCAKQPVVFGEHHVDSVSGKGGFLGQMRGGKYLQIRKSYLVLNSTGKTADIRNYSDDELTRLIAHEIGHALGLGHVEDTDSIMYPKMLPGKSVALSRGDQLGMSELYPQK